MQVTRPFSVDVRLALLELTRRKRRSGVAVGAVAFGVIALMLCAGFIEWIYWSMRESTIRSGLGHIQITRPGYLDAGLADPLSFLLPAQLPPALTGSTPGGIELETVAARVTFFGLISRGEVTLSFQGEGVQPNRERALSQALVVEQGEGLSEHGARREILLGAGLARNLGARVGDTVVLLVNAPGGGVSGAEARVSGFFSSVSKAYDDTSARVPLHLARELLRVQGASKWVVTLPATAGTAEAVAVLQRELPSREYLVTPWTELADAYNKTVVLFSKQVGVLSLIVVGIVILAISNTMTIAVLERTGEIGTALALGVTPHLILRAFLVEGAVLGLAGACIGLLLGLAAAAAISAVGIPMPPPPGMARGYIGEILITPALAAKGVLLALFSAIAGAIVPAWRASRMTVVDAIRRGR